MTGKADFERVNALIAEAVALCEAAQERFDQIYAEFREAIDEGRRLTNLENDEEQKARTALFDARSKLSTRKRALRRLTRRVE